MPARKKAKKKKPTSKPAKVVKKKAKKKTAKSRPIHTEKRKLRLDRFPQEFLKDFNGTQAAIRIGCPPKGAHTQAWRLLRNVEVQKKLRELIQQQTIRTQIDADKVIKEAARVALADVGGAFNKDGTLKGIHDIPKDLRRAISGIETSEVWEGEGKKRRLTGYLKKIKFWSKDKQIEVLMKHLGLFREDNKQVGQTLASAVHQALKDKS